MEKPYRGFIIHLNHFRYGYATRPRARTGRGPIVYLTRYYYPHD